MDQHDIGATHANAVRVLPEAEIYHFPLEAVIRHRPRAGLTTPASNEVVVSHAGETRLYDSPAALYAALRADVRDNDPALQDLISQAQAELAKARTNSEAALRILAIARARRRQVDRLLNLVWMGFLAAGVLGGLLLAVKL